MPVIRAGSLPVLTMQEKRLAFKNLAKMPADADVDVEVLPGLPASVFATAQLVCNVRIPTPTNVQQQSEDRPTPYQHPPCTSVASNYGSHPETVSAIRKALSDVRCMYAKANGVIDTEAVLPWQGITVGSFAVRFLAKRYLRYQEAATVSGNNAVQSRGWLCGIIDWFLSCLGLRQSEQTFVVV